MRFPARTRLAAVLALAVLGSRPAPADVSRELAEKINKAIDKGAAWLVTRWQEDGSFPAVQTTGGASHYTIGTTTLCGLALLASGTPPKADPRWKKCIDFVKTLDGGQAAAGSRNTYDSGCLLMFLTEYYGSKAKVGKGTSARMDPCGLPDDVKAWVQDLATSLEGSQLESGGWRYPAHPPADVSNTQYALLGLRAARDCGAIVRALTFKRSAEWFLGLQQADGPKVQRRTVSKKPGEPEYVIDGGDRARGWPYQQPTHPINGSTTTAALTGLVVCNDALLKPNRFPGYDSKLEGQVRRSVQDGFSWLEANFTVTTNPGGTGWHHSYLYGLERACLLAGRDLLGTKDWYAAGADHLVKSQTEEGLWTTGLIGPEHGPSECVDTAWALLFLKRAVKPAVPVPAPVVTPGGN